MRLTTLTRPLFLLLVPLALSAAAWLVPGSSEQLRGFSVRAPLSFSAVFLLATWYAMVVVVFIIGMRIGRALRPVRSVAEVEEDPRFEHRVVILLTIIAAIGVLYVLYLAQTNGSIIAALQSGQGNQLQQSLTSQAGLTTLRYTPVVAGPLALDLWLRRRGSMVLALFNLALLLAESLFSSRLSLIVATVVFVFLLARRSPQARIKLRWIIVAGAVLFAALAALNYFRNSQYYLVNGVTSPVLMNLYQIATYLGSPFQVSLGVAGGIFDGQYWQLHGSSNALNVFVPSFLTSLPTSSGASMRYGNVVDVAPSLTTNSAFADVYRQYGGAGLVLSLIVIFGGAMVFGHATQYRSSVITAVAGVIGYTLADYWRILMLNQGIVVYLIVITLLLAFVIAHTLPRPQRVLSPTAPAVDARQV